MQGVDAPEGADLVSAAYAPCRPAWQLTMEACHSLCEAKVTNGKGWTSRRYNLVECEQKSGEWK